MNIIKFEQFILVKLKSITTEIIENNLELSISANARAGAEISDWLENKFVEHTKKHEYFIDSESAPIGKTKNPWDVRTYFRINDDIKEEIWIDFKAIKISSANSNPDIGTPNKVINFILQGSFYLVYIYVYYQQKGNGLEFVKFNGNYTKEFFLKDIHHTFRRNPKNQLQVNISKPAEGRTREEFVGLLLKKLYESHQRQIDISKKTIKNLPKIKNDLINANHKSEQNLSKNLKSLDL